MCLSEAAGISKMSNPNVWQILILKNIQKHKNKLFIQMIEFYRLTQVSSLLLLTYL